MNIQKNEAIEIRLLLEAIQLKYGYDFRGYSRATLNRRIKQRLVRSGLRNISEMQHHVIHDTSYFETLLLDLTVNVTEMFRDPSFFRLLRERVFPGLEAKPYIKIWHAGCASGEEVFSWASPRA